MVSGFYLFQFRRMARTAVEKFSSWRAAPVVVLNKQRRRGDKDGCGVRWNHGK